MEVATVENGEHLGPHKLINKNEFIRLLEQALYKLGFAAVAKQLEAASGIQMQPPTATLFQERLLAGEWEGALELLPTLLDSHNSQQTEAELRDARFLIRQQQYLEALQRGHVTEALQVLRNELAPLAADQQTAKLHYLAGLLLMPTPKDMSNNKEAAERWRSWVGSGLGDRAELLAQIQAALPPWVMLPEARLEVLLEQALDTQIARCPYNNISAFGGAQGENMTAAKAVLSGPHISLFTDYQAGVELLPSRCVQVLSAHTDEVWHLAFSHSGQMLASGSKDRTAIIWTVKSVPPLATGAAARMVASNPTQPANAPSLQLAHQLHVLKGHEEPVLFVSWSPNDQHLLTVSDVTIRLWNPVDGSLAQTYTHHKEAVMCCAWFPDSQRFVSGSVDRTLALLDTSGRELQRFRRPYRIQDLAINSTGTELIIAASDKQIHILRLSDQREVKLAEACSITSIDLSADGRFLLANLQSQAVHLWQVGALTQQGIACLGSVNQDPLDKAAMEYKEPGTESDTPGRYVVRSSFGGASGNFVVHGSESGHVFIWHRDTGTLLLRLEGHHATVNACAWPLATPQLLASASDDRTIRLWLAEAALVSARSQGAFKSRLPSRPTL